MGEKEKGILFSDNEKRNGYTRYAAEILLPLLADLNGELTGVKAASTRNDIEYVHQSRVASRRIRAALPFFEPCFEQKSVRNWMRSIRDITRSLGQARDLDVQIEFLTQFIEAHTTRDALIPLFTNESYTNEFQNQALIEPVTDVSQTSSSTSSLLDFALDQKNQSESQLENQSENLSDKIQGWLSERKRVSTQHEQAPHICLQTLSLLEHSQEYNRPGLECMLLRLEQNREAIQPDVTNAVLTFEQSKTLPVMQKYLLSHLTKHQDTPYPNIIYTDAASSILYLIQSLCWYAPSVPDPRKKNMHHEMRIAAKRLRYTLEACNKLYDGSLSFDIKKIKALQTLLGDLHDCDVWIDLIPQFLEDEKKRTQEYFGNDAFLSLIRPGIFFLLKDRVKTREQLHSELVQYWKELVDDAFFVSLKEKVQKKSVSPYHKNKFSGKKQANQTNQTNVSSKTTAAQHISARDEDRKIKTHHQKNSVNDFEKHLNQSEVPSSVSHHDDTIVALIGDVHANLPALTAVLDDAKKRGATMILNAGDLVGYGPYPEEVIETLRSHDVISIIGNYDKSLSTQWWNSTERQSNSLASDLDWDSDPEDTFMLRLKRDVSKWTYDVLSPKSREYLAHLPEQIRKMLHGRELLLVHGSPSSITEYITSETPKTRLSEIAKSSNADIIVSGHAHMPFVGKVDQVLFINTGSVGRSEDGDPRACYALLSCGSDTNLVIEHIRVSYNIDETVSKMEQCDLPELYIRAIREGRSPDLLPNKGDYLQHDSAATAHETRYQESDILQNTPYKKQRESFYGSFGAGGSYSSIYGEINNYKDEF